MARVWTAQRRVSSRAGSSFSRARNDSGCPNHSVKVSGRGKLKTWRLRGAGSNPLVKSVGEVGYRAVGLEKERQGDMINREILGNALGVFRGLRLYPGQCPFRLGFDCPGNPAVDVENIVGSAEARLHRKLAHGDAGAGGELELMAALDQPAGRFEVGVDIAARVLFGITGHVLAQEFGGGQCGVAVVGFLISRAAPRMLRAPGTR